MRIGVDLGFYNVKFASDAYTDKFESIVSPISVNETNDAHVTKEERRTRIEQISMFYEEEMYYVGKQALVYGASPILTFTGDKTDAVSDRIKYMAVLGLLAPTHAESFRVVTGLPVDEYKLLRDRVKANMEGEFHFILNGVQYLVSVENTTVIPQGAGTYYNHILDDTGHVIAANVNAFDVAVDIGYRTTNVVVMRHGRYNATESFTIFAGVSNIHRELRRLIIQMFNQTYPLIEMDQIARQQYIMLNGNSVPIDNLIRIAVSPVIQNILSEIPVYIPQTAAINNMILSGGGVALINTEAFSIPLNCPVMKTQENELDNAVGYKKYDMFLEQQR